MTTATVDDRVDPGVTRVDPRIDRRVEMAVFALPSLFASLHLIRGAGFVLDDWYYLRNGSLDGLGGVVAYGGDRPVGRLIYTVFYGLIGAHPLPMLAAMALMAGLSAVLFGRLLTRFVGPGPASIAAVVWVVVPSHLSLEVWPAVSQAGLAQLCGLGVLVIAADADRSARQTVAACVLTVAAIWSYESVVVVLVPGVVAVQWLAARRIDRRFTAMVGSSAAVAGLWTFLNWNTDREALATVPDLSLVLPANFGWPFSTNASVSDALLLVALVGIITVLGLGIVRPEMRRRPSFGLVAMGTLILALGTAPYLRYLYEPIGAGDRSNYLSSFGAAMVIAGLLHAVWQHRRGLAVSIGLILLLLALDIRWYRTGLWSTAASDGVVVAHAVLDQAEPGVTVSVGPGLVITDNITPFADSSTIRGAVQFLHGSRDVNAVMIYDEAEFNEVPVDQRLDQRQITELDGEGR